MKQKLTKFLHRLDEMLEMDCEEFDSVIEEFRSIVDCLNEEIKVQLEFLDNRSLDDSKYNEEFSLLKRCERIAKEIVDKFDLSNEGILDMMFPDGIDDE